jgi:WD40 repeat protein
MAFSPDGHLLAVADFDNNVYLWDVDKQKQLASLEGHDHSPPGKKNGVFCVAFSPDGKWLATGAGDATVRLWDVEKRKAAATLEGHTERVMALAFSPDSKRLASGGGDNVLRLWDVAGAKEVRPVAELPGPMLTVALHPDGRTAAILQSPNRVRLWDLATSKLAERAQDLHPTATAVLFLPDGKTLLTGDGGKDGFQAWDLQTGKATAWVEKSPRGIGGALAVDAAGKTLVSANPSGKVLAQWDVPKGKIIRDLSNIGGSNIVALAVSPDGQIAAGAGSGANIRLWRLSDGAALLDCAGHPGGTTAVAFSEDGRLLASVGKDRMIRLWETISGKERRAMGGPKGWVRSLAFGLRSRVLATGNTDGVVRVWDAQTGKLLREMPGHRGAVTAVAFTPKGDRLISTSMDGTALVWDVAGVQAEAKTLPPLRLKDDELEHYWRDLADRDVAVAAAATQTLARAPDQAVPLLRERIVPLTDAQLERLIKDLDGDEFKVRRAAKLKLADAGRLAEKALRKAQDNNPSPEAAARIKELLEHLGDQGLTPEQMRVLRGVEVLEMIDDKASREVLQTLADGATDADLTRHAKAALDRMKKRE